MTVSRPTVTAWLVAATSLALSLTASADEPPFPTRTVLDSRTDNWPPGPWKPVKRATYQALINSISRQAQRPRAAWIERARYAARLETTSLRDGILSLELINTTSRTLAVPLAPMRLALSELTLDGHPAVWGTTSQGRSVVVVPPGRHTVSGHWTLVGRNVASLLEFQLHLPVATLSTIDLDLPHQQHLEASQGELAGPQPSSTPERRTWKLALGRRSHCRLLVSRSAISESGSSRLLVRRRTSCVLQPAGAQLVTTLEIERRGEPANRVTLSLPRRVQVESILYEGLPVNARSRGTGDTLFWDVELPDPLIGPGRILQVTGTTAVTLETEWDLPVVDVEGSQLVPRAADSSQPDLSLDVKLPLELKSFQARGLRQTADAVGGRQFTFTRFRADARLRIRTGLPAQSLSADVLTRLSRQQVGWNADVEIVWSANSGNAFLSRCLLAPHWKLVDLKPVSNTSRLEWRTVTRRDSRELLIIEWPDAIDSETPQAVSLQLGRSAGNLSPVDFPLLQPLDCEQHRQILVLAEPSANDRLLSRQGGPLEPVAAETLDDSWSGFSDFETTMAAAAGGVFRCRRPADLAGNDQRPSEKPAPTPGLTEASAAPPASGSLPHPDTEGDAPLSRVTALALQSRLGPAGAVEDQHVAVVTFDGGVFREPFQFTLPAAGELDFVLINGQPARPEIQGTRVSIPPLEQGTFRTIELRYHSPAHSGFLVADRSIPVPQLDDSVAFEWSLAIPPDLYASGHTGSSGSLQPEIAIPWTQRFLGPLGRLDHQPIFNPLSLEAWRPVFGSRQPDTLGETNTGTLWQGTAITPPPRLDVSCIRRGRLAGVSWSLLLACLLGGLVLRWQKRTTHHWLTGGWLGLLVVLSWWMPAPWAILVGGCLAGSLLAMVLPLTLLSRPGRQDWPSLSEAPLDSTRTFQQVPTGLTLLMAFGLFAAAAAQEPANQPEPQVLLPVDAQGNPSTQMPFVFVRPGLIESLREQLAGSQDVPDSLIASAVYTSRVHADQAVDLTVRYEVLVPEKGKTVTVRLPIAGANLGPDSCRVNGRRHPLARSQDSSSLLLELPPPTKSAQEQPQVPEARQPRIDIVELDLRPNIRLSGSGGAFHVVVPPISNSRMKVSVPESDTRLRVSSCLGIQAGRPAGPRTFQLGPVDRLELAWSGPDGLATTQPLATARPVCLVNIHPLATRFHFRVPVEVSAGAIPFVIVSLPGDLVIRSGDVRTGDLLALRTLPRKGPRQELIVEFSKPQTKDFVIELIGLRAHGATDGDRVTLDPTIGLSHSTPTVPLPMKPLWLGVVASRGFQLETTDAPLPDGARIEDVAELARRWTGTETAAAVATLAWSLSAADTIPILIRPLQPRREVKLEHFLHIRPNRVELTVIAAVKTLNASVFQHVLQIDPAIRITSISIQEQDGAERMARRARVDDRLILFLKDQNLFREETQTALQKITIHGELPLTIPGQLDFPRIALEDAQVVDSVLSLYHHPRLAVMLQGAEALSTAETPTEASRDNEAQEVHAGRFRLPADPSEESADLTLDVRRAQLPAALNVVYRLEFQKPSRWKLLMSTVPASDLNSKGPLQLQVSPDLQSGDNEEPPVTIVPAPDRETTTENGRFEADFVSTDRTQLTAFLPGPPENGPWIPPLPQVGRRAINDRVILLDTNTTWIPTGDVSRLDVLPEWIEATRSETDGPGTAVAYRIEGDNWSLVREVPSTTLPAAKPPSMTPAPGQTPRQTRPSATTDVTGRSVWQIAWQTILSLILGIGIVVGLPRIATTAPVLWLRRTDTAAWLLIGAAWWIAGSFSGLGLVVCCGAVVFAFRRTTRHRATGGPILPGTH